MGLELLITIGASIAGGIQVFTDFADTLKKTGEQARILKEKTKELSEVQKNLNHIDNIKQKYSETSKEYVVSVKRLKELKQAYLRSGRSSKELAEKIKLQEKEVQKLNKTKIKQKEIFENVRKVIDKESGSISNYRNKLKELNRDVAIQNKLKNIDDNYTTNLNKLSNYNKIASDGIKYGVGGFGALAVPLKFAMDNEEAQADLKKIISFATDQEQIEFNKKIRNMTSISPLTQSELFEIAGAGAQSGISQNDLADYTRDAQKIKVAFDLNTQSAGEFLAKTRSQLGLNQKQVMEYADTINYLSDNTASKASELVDISQRVANLGGMAGVSKEAVLGFGATLVSVGQTSEQASTGLKNLYSDLMAGYAATKAQKIAFERLGLDAVNISKRMTEDGEGTILKVLTRIKQLPKELQASTIKQIFGQEALTSITNLVANLDQLQTNIELSKNKMKDGAVDREYENRLKTLSNQFKILKNEALNTMIEVGNGIAPVARSALKSFTPFIRLIANFASDHQEVTKFFTNIIIAFSTFGIIAGVLFKIFYGPLRFLLLFFKISNKIKVAGGLTKAYPWILKVGKAFKWMGAIAKSGILKIASGLKMLWGFMMANPIVLIIAGIVAVVVILVVLYKKCKWFRNGVNKMWAVIKKSGIAAWKYIKIYFSYVVGTMKIIFTTMVNHFKSVFKVFYYFFTGQWRKIPGELKNIWNNAVSGVKAFVELIKNTFGGFFSWFGEKWEGLKNGIKSLGSKLNPFNWGKNYTGTNYWQGGLTTVAERGAELIKAPGMVPLLAQGEMLLNLPKGTSILNNSQTRSSFTNKANSLNNKLLSSNKGSRISIGGDSITINVSGENSRGIAKEIERILRERDNRKLRVGIV